LSKEEKEWNKQLTQHIDRYSYLRDWSELAAWLSRLKHLCADRKGPVLDRQLLLKRLATSLNPALPVALHESALEIYEMLFAQSIITGIFALSQVRNWQLHALAFSLFLARPTSRIKRD
jgi:hypothetical protein